MKKQARMGISFFGGIFLIIVLIITVLTLVSWAITPKYYTNCIEKRTSSGKIYLSIPIGKTSCKLAMEQNYFKQELFKWKNVNQTPYHVHTKVWNKLWWKHSSHELLKISEKYKAHIPIFTRQNPLWKFIAQNGWPYTTVVVLSTPTYK
jgi:hypothetical protein